MKKMILILGLCLLAAGTQATTIFDYTRNSGGSYGDGRVRIVIQDIDEPLAYAINWNIPFESASYSAVITQESAPEFWSYITDGEINWFAIFTGAGGSMAMESQFFWNDLSASDLSGTGIDAIYMTLNVHVASPIEWTHSLRLIGTTVPDGGATALLLGCGFFGLVGGRHLLNRRSL